MGTGLIGRFEVSRDSRCEVHPSDPVLPTFVLPVSQPSSNWVRVLLADRDARGTNGRISNPAATEYVRRPVERGSKVALEGGSATETATAAPPGGSRRSARSIRRFP
jgi:hypothetical protein